VFPLALVALALGDCPHDASLGYSLGYYGHHDWDYAWRT
jgi:hypothetical protein